MLQCSTRCGSPCFNATLVGGRQCFNASLTGGRPCFNAALDDGRPCCNTTVAGGHPCFNAALDGGEFGGAARQGDDAGRSNKSVGAEPVAATERRCYGGLCA